jgi:hypothetical protein
MTWYNNNNASFRAVIFLVEKIFHQLSADFFWDYKYFIVIIIIIILGISFKQGIYTYIPETNHVPREHCVATILM